MSHDPDSGAAGSTRSRRLFVYNGGFLTQARVRRILTLAGWEVKLGTPGPDDAIGVWGHSPTAHRGEAMAAKTGARIVRVEDAFLRSLRTGRDGEPPLGLLIDERGVHFDAATPSDLEVLLATHPFDDGALLTRAREATELMVRGHLSKYNAFPRPGPLPEAPYVLVVDQTRGDASIAHAGADAATFREMLAAAEIENPGLRIVIKTHPETAAGHRPGHFGPDDATGHISLLTDPVDPWALMEGAVAVYTVSSGLGFEAILAGHRPHVFGKPWYAGWGLTDDEQDLPRRTRTLTRTQIFAGAMVLYPTWYDPYHDALCGVEQVLTTLEARARAWREDHAGHVAAGMRLWKRAPLTRFFGSDARPRFRDGRAAVALARKTGRSLIVWAGQETSLGDAGDLPVRRVEDGFLRSRGLGAELVPPLSLVTDDLGIYYDPTRECRLEHLIAEAVKLPEGSRHRAERLVAGIVQARLTKYNLDRPIPALPEGHRILVPGQVEDDASIRLGTSEVSTNLALLQAARAANPDAVIVFKPHPDVEAGLRTGAVPHDEALRHADVVAGTADAARLLDACDEVWTMTSLMGFEALLRGKPVTCLGAPFYAGWGLTRDRGHVPERRQARPDMIALAHAVLIDYPRYFDPVTGSACPPEVVADRLAAGIAARTGPAHRLLAKAQGLLASRAWLWR
ncbi:capsular polysaccharide biosynthesis protein [Sinisalibacter aestuarii]|uniref:Capsular polysaccharide biosynthesis protein n=1 Tax=Sinisalibacter aestuarii TaxID=2949426 RepID=A0ABQ5LUN0_9RHOB|nr:capsular polysaccharide biosynthesis protein [Sinisalibacter aestuarii]GKY88682.1 capsular polysaccharide biosynthesis protein [Sinisalibacter aestuarii]